MSKFKLVPGGKVLVKDKELNTVYFATVVAWSDETVLINKDDCTYHVMRSECTPAFQCKGRKKI